MKKEPRIKLENLYWAYNEDLEIVLPYVFNKENTAIKVLSEQYAYKVLQLNNATIMDTKPEQKATRALDKEYGEGFANLSTFNVFDKTFGSLEGAIRLYLADGDFDDIKLSMKDVEKMRIKYTKHMKKLNAAHDKLNRKYISEQTEQEMIRDF